MGSVLVVENQCSATKIDDRFLPIIEDAIVAYQVLFGSSTINIRLMGSVARGEAGTHSDIDFIAVLKATPTDEQLQRIEDMEGELKQKHPPIARVDLEAVAAEDLHPFRRFVFATDSVSLFGIDTYSTPSQSWDRQELAALITPDLEDIVDGYRNAVGRTDGGNSEALRFYSRIIGKDILKCLRGDALRHGGSYERSVGNMYAQLLQFLPDRQQLLNELIDLYKNPSNDLDRLLRVLDSI